MTRIPYRRLLLAALLVGAVAATYFALRPAPHAAGTAAESPAALVLVKTRPDFAPLGGRPEGTHEAERSGRFLSALVRSEFVINAALRDPKVAGLEPVRGRADAAAWLAARVTAASADGSVVRVQVRDVAPGHAAALANAVARAAVEQAAEMEAREHRERLSRLEDARARLRKQADGQRENLHQTAARIGVPPDRADQRALVAALYAERASVRAELRRAGAGAGGCPEDEREKALRAQLTETEERIRACERADLDALRAEVVRLETAEAAFGDEILRVRLASEDTPRVSVLALAEAPEENSSN